MQTQWERFCSVCGGACPPDCPSAVSCPKEILVLSLSVLTLTPRDLRAEC